MNGGVEEKEKIEDQRRKKNLIRITVGKVKKGIMQTWNKKA